MSEVWLPICSEDDLVEGAGVCALLSHGGINEQVALFKLKDQEVYAISNYDPLGEANVLSRGIIGSLGENVVVASPLYKQHYSLSTGKCLEDESVSVKTWPVRVEDGKVLLRAG